MASAGLAGETQWQKDHPRRAEVNGRLKNQNKRTNQGVKNGKLTSQQAGQLHHEDRQIRQEERDMASQNGGHITRQEQKTLAKPRDVNRGAPYVRRSPIFSTASGPGAERRQGGTRRPSSNR